MNAEEFTESFIRFEKENKMFDLRIGGCQVWMYVRALVHTNIKMQLGMLGDISTNRSREDVEWGIGEKIKYLTVCNQYFATHRDVLIVSNPRKVKENGKYRCIYTDLLDRMLQRTHYVWDRRNLAGLFLPQESNNIIYMDDSLFLKRRTDKIQMTVEWFEEYMVKPIENYFRFSVCTEMRKRIFLSLNHILSIRKNLIHYYTYMLKKIKPKVILLTCYYDFYMMLLCAVGRHMGIPVIELQHGAIGSEHIAYNFPDKMRTNYIPNYIFVYGEYDKKTMRFPIPKSNIIPVGNPELEKKCGNAAEKENSSADKRKNILFVSSQNPQIAISANCLAEHLDTNEYRIIFKLHPLECDGWKKILGRYITCGKVEVVDDKYADIYSYLCIADWVVGTSSTVLLEATMFDAKIAILYTSNSTGNKALYESKRAVLIHKEEELIKVIEEDSFVPKQGISIYEKDSLNKMIAGIEHVISANP